MRHQKAGMTVSSLSIAKSGASKGATMCWSLGLLLLSGWGVLCMTHLDERPTIAASRRLAHSSDDATETMTTKQWLAHREAVLPVRGDVLVIESRPLYHWRNDCPFVANRQAQRKLGKPQPMPRQQAIARNKTACGACLILNEKDGKFSYEE